MHEGNRANALNSAHRPKSLLAGVLKCGVCGGGYTLTGADRYGCAMRRSKGTCTNGATIGRREMEARLLVGLKLRLMAPELIREFVESFQREATGAPRWSASIWPSRLPPA